MSAAVRCSVRGALVTLPLLLAACDATLPWSDGRSAAEAGGLSLLVDTVTFIAEADGVAPSARSVRVVITHSEAAYVAVTAAPGAPEPAWLTAELASSNEPGSVSLRLSVRSTHLLPGTRETTVRVAIGRADRSLIASRDLLVRYVLTPSFHASTSTVELEHVVGEPAPATTAVELSGTAGVAWNASASHPWVTLGAAAGVTPSSLQVGVEPLGLAPGTHDATVTVTGAGKTLTIHVALLVRAPAPIAVPAALVFSGIQGARLEPQPVALSFESGGAVGFTAAPSAAWISVDPASGTTPATVAVAVDTAALSPGTHSGAVTFLAGGQTVAVGVSVQLAAPTLVTSQGALAFSGIRGAAVASQSVSVSLDSGVAAAFTAVASAPWIVVTPAAGATPSAVSIGVDTSELTPGDHAGAVTFTSGASTATLPVTLRLRAPVLVTSKASLAFSGSSAGRFATQTLDVSLDSGVTVGFTASASAPWIVVTPVAGTTPASMTIGIDPAGLAPRAYTGHVTIASGGLTAIVPVNLELRSPVLRAYATDYWEPHLYFSGVLGTSIAPQPLRILLDTGGALPFTVTEDVSWLTVDATSGVTPDQVTVGVAVAGLSPGRHTATFTVSTADETIPVSVTLDVSAPTLWASGLPWGVTVGGVRGGRLAAATIDVGTSSAAPAAFTVTPSAGWMVVSPVAGETPARLSVAFDASSGAPAPGTYTGTVKIEAVFEGRPLQAVVVPVTGQVFRPTMHLVHGGLLLGSANGLAAASTSFSIDTGSNAYPWTAIPSQPWITLPVAAGTVSADYAKLSVAPDIAGLAPGVYTGEVELVVDVLGDLIRRTLPITLELNPHELRVPTRGVAFTSRPGASRLARSVRLRDDRGEAVAWSAVGDQPWLTVTPSGTTPAELVISADPDGLAAGTLHLGHVTVSSTTPGVENVETVRVGLWVDDAASAPAVAVPGDWRELVADPVRPWVYVHDGGTDILALDVHTGATVATFAGVGTALAGLAVSGDGSTLWAIDQGTSTVVPIDLDQRSIGTPWSTWFIGPEPRHAWLRLGGHELLVMSDGWLRDARTGALLADVYQPGYAHWPTASAGGEAFCLGRCYGLAHSAFATQPWVTRLRSFDPTSRDTALSADGRTAYAPTWDGSTWIGTDLVTGVETFRPTGAWQTTSTVEVGWDERVYAGRSGAPAGEPDVLVFGPTGAPLGGLTFHQDAEELVPGRLVLSGDGLRAVAITSALATDGAGHLRTLPVP